MGDGLIAEAPTRVAQPLLINPSRASSARVAALVSGYVSVRTVSCLTKIRDGAQSRECAADRALDILFVDPWSITSCAVVSALPADCRFVIRHLKRCSVGIRSRAGDHPGRNRGPSSAYHRDEPIPERAAQATHRASISTRSRCMAKRWPGRGRQATSQWYSLPGAVRSGIGSKYCDGHRGR